jgi:hypothetical protein
VTLRTDPQSRSSGFPYSEYLQLRGAASTFRAEAWIRDAATVSIPGAVAEHVQMAFVSGGFFETFGSRQALGRVLQPADDAAQSETAAVLNHAYWKARLNADPTVVGRTVTLAGTPVSIVGVAGRRFNGPFGGENPPAIFLPLSAAHRVYDYLGPFHAASARPVTVAARLAPGAHLDSARAEATALAAALSGPTSGMTFSARLEPISEFTAEDLAMTSVVFTILGLVVLVACANVANLLLAGAIARRQEIGARLALGASRGRIIRQLLTESLLLGAAAGAGGLWLAYMLLPLAAGFGVPPTYDIAPDLRVYWFVALITAACSVAAGLAPARHSTRRDLVTPLMGGGLQATGARIDPRRHATRTLSRRFGFCRARPAFLRRTVSPGWHATCSSTWRLSDACRRR